MAGCVFSSLSSSMSTKKKQPRELELLIITAGNFKLTVRNSGKKIVQHTRLIIKKLKGNKMNSFRNIL